MSVYLLLQVVTQQLHVLHQLQILHPLLPIVVSSLGGLLVFNDAHLRCFSNGVHACHKKREIGDADGVRDCCGVAFDVDIDVDDT